jgi:hypothetical protein
VKGGTWQYREMACGPPYQPPVLPAFKLRLLFEAWESCACCLKHGKWIDTKRYGSIFAAARVWARSSDCCAFSCTAQWFWPVPGTALVCMASGGHLATCCNSLAALWHLASKLRAWATWSGC